MLTMHWQSLDVNVAEETPSTLAAASSSANGEKDSKDDGGKQADEDKVAGVKHIANSAGEYIN